MMADFFDPSNLISIIKFLAAFNLACYTNNINVGAAMWVLLFVVKNAQTTSLNSCMSAAAHIKQFFLLVNITVSLIQKKLQRSHSEVVNYLHKNSGTIRQFWELISRSFATFNRRTWVQRSKPMIFMQNLVNSRTSRTNPLLTIFSLRVLNLPSICHSLRKYWDSHPQADVSDTAFKSAVATSDSKSSNQTG